jgi:DNA uptake protein ComE-like DNA-binding protein
LRTAPLGDKNQLVQAIRFPVLLLPLLLAIPAGAAQDQAGGAPGHSRTSSITVPAAALVDINHASVNELMTVPGMTRSWAARIVRFRPYYTKQDLLDWGVVSSQVYDRIRDHVIAHRDKP